MTKSIFSPSIYLAVAVSALSAKIIYVDDNSTSGGNGSSWANAYKYLQDGIQAAQQGDEIWVAEGIYKPNQGSNQQAGRESHFKIKDSIKLLGAFIGDETSLPPQGNPNNTLLSGDIASDSTYWSLRILVCENISNAEVSGFKIAYSNSNGSEEFGRGGGLYIENSEVKFRACIFENLLSPETGWSVVPAAIYANNSNVQITNSVISEIRGSPIYLDNSTATLRNTSLLNSGITAYAMDSELKLVNCLSVNSSYHISYSGPVITTLNSIFVGSKFTAGGTWDGLSLGKRGGSYWTNYKEIIPKVEERYPGDPLYVEGILTAPNLFFDEANVPENFFQNFEDFKGPDEFWFSSDDGLAPKSSSSAIDAGSTAHLFENANEYNNYLGSGSIDITDITNYNRIVNNVVDLGPYEHQPDTDAGQNQDDDSQSVGDPPDSQTPVNLPGWSWLETYPWIYNNGTDTWYYMMPVVGSDGVATNFLYNYTTQEWKPIQGN